MKWKRKCEKIYEYECERSWQCIRKLWSFLHVYANMVLYILKSKLYFVYLFDIKESDMCTVVVYLWNTTYGEHERPNLS